jgi:menaquinone-dependent protoporphyrinogen oxidase
MGEKVLVAYGSKHGMTAQIAERIGKVLRGEGVDAEVASADRANAPGGYRAVVLGAGVRSGAPVIPSVFF